MKTVLRALVEAAELLDSVGWIQHDGGNSKIGFCALGALNLTALGWNMFNNCKLSLARAMGTASYKIVEWNDKPGRTKEEVLAAFRKTIENERISPSD